MKRSQTTAYIIVVVMTFFLHLPALSISPDVHDDVLQILERYRKAWEEKNPFGLIALTPEGSNIFLNLLKYERFDHIKRT